MIAVNTNTNLLFKALCQFWRASCVKEDTSVLRELGIEPRSVAEVERALASGYEIKKGRETVQYTWRSKAAKLGSNSK